RSAGCSRPARRRAACSASATPAAAPPSPTRSSSAAPRGATPRSTRSAGLESRETRHSLSLTGDDRREGMGRPGTMQGEAAEGREALRRGGIAGRADPRTVGGALIHAAASWPEHEALLIDSRRASYATLLDEVHLYARALIGAGVRKGDNLGILMPNC